MSENNCREQHARLRVSKRTHGDSVACKCSKIEQTGEKEYHNAKTFPAALPADA